MQHPERLNACLLRQVHGTDVHERTYENANERLEGDAQWTSQDQLRLAIQTADCTPILVAASRPERGVHWVAALHCGWRSGLGGIIGRLKQNVSADSCEQLSLWFGPSIGRCCFQVGPEVVSQGQVTLRHLGLQAEDWWGKDPKQDGKFLVDLSAHYRHQFRALFPQVSLKFHESENKCTRCNVHEYFSYRAEGATGRLYGIISKQQSMKN